MKRLFSCAIAIILFLDVLASGSVNELDARGNRQGFWTITGNIARDVRYPGNGRVEEGNYINGKKTGEWKGYWPSGKIRSQIEYQHGTPLGNYILFYENGQAEESGVWHYGRYKGAFKRYYPNGKVQQALYFDDHGHAEGLQIHYFEDGSTAMRCHMIQGKESGEIYWFEPGGSELASLHAIEGKSISSTTLRTHSDIIGLPWKDIYPGLIGKPSEASDYKPNSAQIFEVNGYNTLYDYTGRLMQTGYFRRGILYKGKWYFYDADGILISIRCYHDGLLIGQFPIPDQAK